MNWLRPLAALATSALLVLSSVAHAAPITFTFTGSGSGTLAGNGFSEASFTITGSADTANLQVVNANVRFIDHLAATIQIAGVGTLTFLTGTRTFFNDTFDIVGFSRSGAGGADLFSGPVSAALAGYDLVSAIGPIAGTANLLQWGNSPVLTSGGVLFFNNGTSAATFQATTGTTVPEPGTLALTATVLLGLAAARRRRA